MKNIVFKNPHRQKHFEFFKGMNHPHFNVTANVDVTPLLKYLKGYNLPTTFSLVYLISRAANEIPEFRWRIRAEKVVEHEIVRPSFTVPTDEADVFSFCTVPFIHHAPDFIDKAKEISLKMKNEPVMEDEEGKDDYLFLSALPWISFTSIQHAMNYHPNDSVPRISWGKFFNQNNKTLMPLSVQVHHAVVDGRHVGAYFEKLEHMTALPEVYFG